MAARFRTAFFAYPGAPADLVATITAAAEGASNSAAKVSVETWPQMDVFGAHIPSEVKTRVRAADVLVCDVTRPNMNVYYEAGLALGQGKTLAPVANSSFANAISDLQRDGIFDNVGYRLYENSEQLTAILQNLPKHDFVSLYGKAINHRQPLYFLSAFRKTDFINAIVSAIKDSKVFYRSFDPVETPRFSTVPVLSEVSSSAGVVIPLLSSHIDDAARHNLRAAFLAGLSHGLDRQTLLLELQSRDDQNPADYRELVIPVRNEEKLTEIVVEFAKTALVSSQSISGRSSRQVQTPLQRISLGASAAENEFRTLGDYFVETAEFLRTLRGDVTVVAGRKGSGKRLSSSA